MSKGEIQFCKNGGFVERECATSLNDFGCSDRRIASGQEAKWFYTSRTTHGHWFREFSTNSMRLGFYPTCFTLCLSVFMMLKLIEAVSGHLIGPKYWNRIVGIVELI